MSVQLAFEKALNYNKSAFLQQEVATCLAEKICEVDNLIDTSLIVDVGAGSGFLQSKIAQIHPHHKVFNVDFSLNLLKQNPHPLKIAGDAHHLPLKPEITPLLISNLMMQWCQIQPMLDECMRVLTPGGIMFFSTLGPDTLQELRDSWAMVDKKTHVNQFHEMHEIGNILQSKHFEGVMLESERIKVTYEKVSHLLRDIKGVGAQTVHNRHSSLTTKADLQKMYTAYERYRTETKLPATYEVIYLRARKPKG